MTQDSKATQEHRTIMVDPSSQDFWRRQFPCPVELVRLPCDKPRPPVPSYLRDTVVLALNPSLNDALFELSSRLNVSPLAIFLAAFKIVLFRYSGQETLVVGVTAQTSKILADSRVNGHALLPIQSHWSAPSELSGQALVCELAQRLAEAAAHARYSIRELRSWAGAQDSAYGARLFSVVFCLAYDSQEDGQAWPMLNSESSEFLAQCDLTVTVMSTASSLILQGHFDTDLFEASTIQRLLGHIGMILEGIIRDPSVTVLRLPILTATERQELLVEWNGSNTQAPPSATLHGLFEAQVERNPEALALTCEGHSLTYGELNQRANRLAHALRERGVGPEVMVAIYIDRSLELVIGMLGILKAGGAYLPIDLAYPKERIAIMLEDARAPLLLTQSKLAANLPLLKTQVVYLEDAELSDFQSYPTSNPSSGATTENLAYIIYTSGTTGLPKGSLITHRNVVRLFIATDRWYGFNSNDVWTLFHSCAFDFSVWEIWGGLLYGGRVIVVPFLMSRSPEAFYELLANEQVTVLSQTPSAFRQLIQAEQSVGKKDLALRYVVFGGEALEMHSLRPWFERHGDLNPRLVNMYGITETTVHVTYRPLSKNDLDSGSVIGVPIPDLQIYILDTEQQPVPIGVPGEMYIGGAGLARGYLHRPELTAAQFIPNRLIAGQQSLLYKTGDLARFLPNRDIEYLGRTDDQVKIRGFRIELGEIESLLCQHPAVQDARVIAREDVPGEKRLVAYLVTPSSPLDVRAVREHLKMKLPEYMVPAAFVVLDALPLTPNGKLDRKALPPPKGNALSGPDDSHKPPDNEAERKIAEVWQDVLGITKISRDANFFDLGGDSLSLIRVRRLLQHTFSREPSMVDLFTFTTVRALAHHLTGSIKEAVDEPNTRDVIELRKDAFHRRRQLQQRITDRLGPDSDGPNKKN